MVAIRRAKEGKGRGNEGERVIGNKRVKERVREREGESWRERERMRKEKLRHKEELKQINDHGTVNTAYFGRFSEFKKSGINFFHLLFILIKAKHRAQPNKCIETM